jgi:hypothetical protein
VEHLHWFGWSWCLCRFGWSLLRWWTCWLVVVGFLDVVEAWLFCGINDGGEDLSGWMVKRDLVLVEGLG